MFYYDNSKVKNPEDGTREWTVSVKHLIMMQLFCGIWETLEEWNKEHWKENLKSQHRKSLEDNRIESYVDLRGSTQNMSGRNDISSWVPDVSEIF